MSEIPGDVLQMANEAVIAFLRDNRTSLGVKMMVTGETGAALLDAIANAIVAEREGCISTVKRMLVYADTTSDADNAIIAALRSPAHAHGGE